MLDDATLDIGSVSFLSQRNIQLFFSSSSSPLINKKPKKKKRELLLLQITDCKIEIEIYVFPKLVLNLSFPQI